MTYAIYVPSLDSGFGDYLRYAPSGDDHSQRQIISFNSIPEALDNIRTCNFTDSTSADVYRSAYVTAFPRAPKKADR